MSKKPSRRTTDNASSSGIGANKVVLDHEEYVKFSFKYLDPNHGKFSFSSQDVQYFLKLLERLTALSFKDVADLQGSHSHRSLRFHGIKWGDTSESSFGLPNEEQLVDKPWQFEISANEHGRVHGFFIGSVFYVRWLDPAHLLYS